MDKLSFMDELLAFLTSAHSTKIYRENLRRILREKRSNFNNETFRRYIGRLHSRNIIKINVDHIIVSKKKLKKLNSSNLDRTNEPQGKESFLIFYDIPESMRFARRLLREQLKLWKYKMIQQSVWFGPGPLPAQFTEQLKKWGIFDRVQITRVGKKSNRDTLCPAGQRVS